MAFKILQWADTHHAGQISQCEQVISTASDIDAVIHCGDFPPGWFQQGIGSVNLATTLCVIGNHDAINQSGADPAGYRWNDQPSQSSLRNRYISPIQSAFDVYSPDGATWWRKVYDSAKVIVIGINDTALDSVADAQLSFVEESVKLAESENLAIVMVKHGPTSYSSVLECNFTVANALTGEVAEFRDYENHYPKCNSYIAPLIRSSAKVVCVLHGHDHWDVLGTITKVDGSKFPTIGIGSVLADGYNDVPRTSNNTICDVVMNQIEWHPNQNTLEVYRIGSFGTKSGCVRKMLVWDYSTSSITSVCSNR